MPILSSVQLDLRFLQFYLRVVGLLGHPYPINLGNVVEIPFFKIPYFSGLSKALEQPECGHTPFLIAARLDIWLSPVLS